MLKSIETLYNGHRFRSRLEARWAVFFDSVKAPWMYEPEGFDLGKGIYYLPDFYLPDAHQWVEVKGVMTHNDEVKIEAFRKQSKEPLIVVGDFPPEGADVVSWAYDTFPAWERFSIGNDFPYLPCLCPKCKRFAFQFDGRGARVCEGRHGGGDKGYTADHPLILTAYRNAKQARFEHHKGGKA